MIEERNNQNTTIPGEQLVDQLKSKPETKKVFLVNEKVKDTNLVTRFNKLVKIYSEKIDFEKLVKEILSVPGLLIKSLIKLFRIFIRKLKQAGFKLVNKLMEYFKAFLGLVKRSISSSKQKAQQELPFNKKVVTMESLMGLEIFVISGLFLFLLFYFIYNLFRLGTTGISFYRMDDTDVSNLYADPNKTEQDMKQDNSLTMRIVNKIDSFFMTYLKVVKRELSKKENGVNGILGKTFTFVMVYSIIGFNHLLKGMIKGISHVLRSMIYTVLFCFSLVLSYMRKKEYQIVDSFSKLFISLFRRLDQVLAKIDEKKEEFKNKKYI